MTTDTAEAQIACSKCHGNGRGLSGGDLFLMLATTLVLGPITLVFYALTFGLSSKGRGTGICRKCRGTGIEPPESEKVPE